MHSAKQGSSKNILPAYYMEICNKQNINPDSDLFMIGGLDPQKRRYIMFNSFYKDKNSGTDCVQVFYVSSESSALTKPQKDIIKVFNDVRNKKFLSLGSTTNPLSKVCTNDTGFGGAFQSAISILEWVSKPIPECDMLDLNGDINPVIYTQKPDGDYIRYKVITLYK